MRDAWMQRDNESSKAYAAFCVYRDLGPDRSLDKVVQKLAKSVQLFKRWSSQHNWVERARAWDEEQDRLVAIARKAEIARIMSEGFANVHTRVKYLNELAERQWRDMQDEERVWLPDVKQIGGGQFAERVDIIRYNAALDEQFRATLDDIASELSQRVKKTDLNATVQTIKIEYDDSNPPL